MGSFGVASLFSFDTSKGLNAFGGGAVATNDPALAYEVRSAEEVLRRPTTLEVLLKVGRSILHEFFTRWVVFSLLVYPVLRLNFYWGPDLVKALFRESKRGLGKKAGRFTNIQAVVGNRQMAQMELLLEARRENVQVLEAMLGPCGLLRTQQPPGGSHPAYLTYTLLVPRPSELAGELLKRGVDSMRETMQNCDESGAGGQAFPAAVAIEREHLHLPVYAGLRREEMERIAQVVLDFVRSQMTPSYSR